MGKGKLEELEELEELKTNMRKTLNLIIIQFL